MRAVGNAIGYSAVNKVWVSLSTSTYDDYKSVAPESWKELLPLIRKVKTTDPYAYDDYD